MVLIIYIVSPIFLGLLGPSPRPRIFWAKLEPCCASLVYSNSTQRTLSSLSQGFCIGAQWVRDRERIIPFSTPSISISYWGTPILGNPQLKPATPVDIHQFDTPGIAGVRGEVWVSVMHSYPIPGAMIPMPSGERSALGKIDLWAATRWRNDANCHGLRKMFPIENWRIWWFGLIWHGWC